MSLKIWLPLNGNIENQGTLNTTSRLPSGYTEVEYLQSSGTQWINTNDKLTSDFKMVYSINVQNGGSGSAMPWASYTSGNRYDCQFPEHTAIWFQRAEGTLYRGNLDGTILNKDLYIEESLNSVSINGKVYGTGSFTFTQNNVNVGLFNSPGSSYQSANKCRTFKWFAGNTLKHCFIPCYRNSDNKPGMYDTVTGTFYTNAGSGEFSVGPAVTCSITGTNYAVSNPSGKIGSCYYGNKWYLTIPVTINTANGVTFCGWAKSSSSTQSYSNPFGYSDNSNIHTSGNTRRLEWVGGQDFYWYDGGIISNGIALGRIPSINDWFHFAISCDGAKTYCYFNGVLASTHNVDMNTIINNVYVFNTPTYSDRGNFFINDFRVYDECLSADQIKEISRGLVLHYKMCQPERSENLLANGAATEITCRSKNPDYPLKAIRTTLENNTQYTLSFDAKSDNGLGTFYCSLANGGSSQIYFATKIKPTTKYKHFVYTATRGTQTTNNILFAAYYGWSENANVTDTIYIKNVKLEKGSNPNATFSPPSTETLNWGTIEYDGSGFKNHGIVTAASAPTLSSDTKRYDGSYLFNGGQYIRSNNKFIIGTGDLTVSAWIKLINCNNSYQHILSCKNTSANSAGFSCNYNGAREKFMWQFCDGSTTMEIWTADTFPKSDIIGKWVHVVMIRNASDPRKGYFYINGLRKELTSIPTILNIASNASNLAIGACGDVDYSAYHWNGNISDVRIYATALDATDVAELYKLGRN